MPVPIEHKKKIKLNDAYKQQCCFQKLSIAIVQIKVVIHCNAADRKVRHYRLNNISMVVVNTKFVFCNDAYKNSWSKICQSHL